MASRDAVSPKEMENELKTLAKQHRVGLSFIDPNDVEVHNRWTMEMSIWLQGLWKALKLSALRARTL